MFLFGLNFVYPVVIGEATDILLMSHARMLNIIVIFGLHTAEFRGWISADRGLLSH